MASSPLLAETEGFGLDFVRSVGLESDKDKKTRLEMERIKEHVKDQAAIKEAEEKRQVPCNTAFDSQIDKQAWNRAAEDNPKDSFMIAFRN